MTAAEAYGWLEKEEILERLVALHDERVEGEKRGLIRWLRPDYQIPRIAPEPTLATLALEEAPAKPKRGRKTKVSAEEWQAAAVLTPWPGTATEQIGAIGALLAQRSLSAVEVAAAFAGTKKELVARHLETLALMGEIVATPDGKYRLARRAA